MFFFGVLAALLLASGAAAHDYMTEPQSRTMTYSRRTPCDADFDADRPAKVVVSGETMNVRWRGVHAPDRNVVRFALVPVDLEANADFSTYVFNETTYDQPSIDLLIPRGVKAGRYTLQWKWTDWMSCTDLWVVDRRQGSYFGKDGGLGGIGPKGEFDSRTSGAYDYVGLAVGLGILFVILGAVVGAFVYLSKNKPEVIDNIKSVVFN